ncbi:MAG: ATP-binding protein [Solirubrobacteraceae bacterium]
MRPLIDRELELARLRELHESAPSLVVLSGRRRVGKTFLLAHAFVGERVVSYQADEQPRSVQLAAFAAEVARLLPGAPPLSFRSWDEALEFLGSQAAERPLVAVIDEFQYACGSEPALPSVVQRHWDRWDRDGTPVCLVLSGSALTFMEGLLSGDAPLHGRATYRPTIDPLDYRDAAKLAPARSSPEQLVERYAVIGGTPQYQVWAGERSLERVVRETILRKGAPLYEEPLTLMRQERGIRDPMRYFGVLAAIASGRTRNSQIGSLLELPSSNVAVVLDRLAALGYVRERRPAMPGVGRRRGFWHIDDPFFRFWFRRVAPNRSRLDRGEAVDAVWEQVQDDLDTYVGRIFEDVCRLWLGRYSEIEEAASAVNIGSWWSRDGRHEIDVACTDKHQYTLFGSCKWSRRLVDEDALDALIRSVDAVEGRTSGARLVLFARRGFTRSLQRRAAREGVLLVRSGDLFA